MHTFLNAAICDIFLPLSATNLVAESGRKMSRMAAFKKVLATVALYNVHH